MKKKILSALLGAIAFPALAFAQAPAAALPDADPAMWVVRDQDTTIYLFGTVHAFDGKKAWFNDEVKTAYDASQEVVFEALIPDAAKVQPVLMDKAVDKSGKTLSSRLSPEQAKKVAAELTSVGAPANALDQFEPWFASTQLAMVRFMRKGITPEHGSETVLKAQAAKDGKTLGEVESFEWQINMFDSMPEDLQLKMLTGYLDELDTADALIGDMMDSWATGNIDKLAGLMNKGMEKTPQLGKMLLDDRNARWADWIKARMDKPGTVFMAVGAGHLGGKNSVQDFLAKKGIKAERVKN
jgi:uncharacterized protein YbaP (TraB family)